MTGTIKSGFGKVDVYYNATKGMFISGILEHGRPGEVCNNYTSGSDSEVKPERHNYDFTTKLS